MSTHSRFVEAPSPRAIADGYQLLQELGAVDDDATLTPLGRELARLAGRSAHRAHDRSRRASAVASPRCSVIASALSVPDPRDRPLAKQQAADQAHLALSRRALDFLSLLALWEFFAERSSPRSSRTAGWSTPAARSSFRTCGLREWRDVHAQLANEIARAGLEVATPTLPATIDAARYRAIHEALLAGLLGNIGTKDADGDGVPGRARHRASTCIRARASRRRRPKMGARRRGSSRRRASTRAARRRSSPNGSRRSPATA